MRIIKESIVGQLSGSRHAARIAALSTTAAIAFTAFGATSALADENHKVAPGDTVGQLAHRYGSSVDSIIAANRLNSRATIYIGSTITIPTGPGTTTKSVTSGAAKKPAATTGKHTVAAGDTVWGLARQYDTTVSAIIKANRLGKSALIRAGQKLVIPGTKASSSAPSPTSGAKAAPASAAAVSGSHKVAPGDTVWDLARKYGSSVSAIVQANGLNKAATIRIGQRLSIPGASAPGSSTATTVSNVKNVETKSSGTPKLATDKNLEEFGGASAQYTVAAGDTMSKIARAFSVSIDSIVKANGIKNPALITVGQKITIPGGTPTGLVGDTFLGKKFSAPVVGAANQNKATLQSMEVPSRAEMQSMVVRIAKEMGVDPALAQAIAYQESGFNMRAVSPANAIGVMQVIPTSGQWASDLIGRDLNLLIPEDNVTAGIVILKKLQRNGISLENAIGGYYQGETAVRKYGLYSDTKRYVASVQSLMTRFR